MKEIKTNLELNEEIKNSNTVILKVGTGCCGPCQLVEKNLESIESQYPETTFIKVDAEECDEEVIDDLGIRNIPTLIKYKAGEEKARIFGMQTPDNIKKFISNGE